jgi:hypothetical protein
LVAGEGFAVDASLIAADANKTVQPSSCKRCTKAERHRLVAAALAVDKNPMVGNFPACCARASSGHAAAPPTNEMKVRRLMYPSSRGPSLPYRRGAETALCSTANSKLERYKWVMSGTFDCQLSAWLVRFSPLATDIGATAMRIRLLPTSRW